ncbi:MAG: prolyl oligopeptidase family serine peptidase [Nibricoccus sp.]
MRYLRLVLILALLGSGIDQTTAAEPSSSTAEPEGDRFVDLFTPFKTERATLSPDGKYLAYTLREGENLSVVVVDVDNPTKATAKVTVVTDSTATPIIADTLSEKVPGNIRWMRWVSPTRLVIETNRNYPQDIKIGFVEKWVNCTGDIIGVDADGQNAKTLVTPRDVGQWISDPTYGSATGASGKERILPPAQSESGEALKLDPNFQRWQRDRARGQANMISIPRTPRIVDIFGGAPDTVLVRAEGIAEDNASQETHIYKLNVATGELKEFSHESVTTGKVYLFDRTGKARIAISSTTREKFPHVFTYDSEKFIKRWKPLNDLAKDGMAKGFVISPDNYFGERSIPLGFDYDQTTLYFASNVGRNTYGLYAMNMKTGERAHLAAENPTFDLFTPAPGVFPDEDRSKRDQRGDSFAEQFVRVENDLQAQESSTEPSSPTSTTLEKQYPIGDANGTEAVLAKTISDSLFKKIETQFSYSARLGSTEDRILVFDRFNKKLCGLRYEGATYTCSWFPPELQSAQKLLEARFPARSVDILEWDQALQRFLVRVRGNVDPGAFFVFDTSKNRLALFAQRNPTLAAKKVHEITMFSFLDSKGRTVTGTFTFPSTARLMPVPVVAFCSSYPWERVHADYQPELQAFANMGLAVIQVNNRGAWGFGVKHREAVRPGYEDSQLEDIIAAIDFLAKRVAINPKRVALVGKNHGGYVAIRGLQLYPQRFRGAVAVDAMLDPAGWLKENRWTNAETGPALVQAFLGDPQRLAENPILRQAEMITKPVLLLNYNGSGDSIEKSAYSEAKRLTQSLRQRQIMSELYALSDDYVAGMPKAKAEVFQHIENFLNTYIYDFSAKAGDLKVIKQDDSAK